MQEDRTFDAPKELTGGCFKILKAANSSLAKLVPTVNVTVCSGALNTVN